MLASHHELTTKPLSSRSKTNRSRVTNGKSVFIGREDQRSSLARRFRDLVALHTSDLGGAEELSQAQQQLIRRIATLEVQLEVAEGRMVSGETTAADLSAYATAANSLRRMLLSLGLKPVEKMNRLHVTVAAHQRMVRTPAKERCDQITVRQRKIDEAQRAREAEGAS